MSDNLPAAADEWRKSVIRVGGGRGFVVAHGERKYVATAAHCLPFMPPAHGVSELYERTAYNLLARLEEEPSVPAEIIFVDPIADIALLAEPDIDALKDRHTAQSEAYNELVEYDVSPIPISTLPFTRLEHRLSPNQVVLGPPEATAAGWLLSLKGDWFACDLSVKRAVSVVRATQPLVAGMSGSPIITQEGAIGIFCVSCNIANDSGHHNPYLPFALPAWMM